ncbi:MAG: ComF family protein [Pseudomonadota bacterium]
MKSLLNLFFPQQCLFCDIFQDKDILCSNCLESLHFLESEFNAPYLRQRWFNQAYSVLAYEGQVVQAIASLKYKRQFHLIRFFVDLLAAKLTQMPSYDLIVPVPLHWYRLISRGYNQAGLLSKAVGKKMQLKYDLFALKRSRNIPAQVGLGREERLKNVTQAFMVRPNRVSRLAGKSILLLDDVMTTGATVNECAKVLVKNGKCGKVDILTVARTL